MNSLLFERSSGNIGPDVFARIQTTALLRSFWPAPRLRFDGGERGPGAAAAGEGGSAVAHADNLSRASLWAHQAGVSALALERFDGRM